MNQITTTSKNKKRRYLEKVTSRPGGDETGGVWQTSVWVENVRQQFTIRILSEINVNIKWAPKRPPEITNYDNIYQSEIYRKEIHI